MLKHNKIMAKCIYSLKENVEFNEEHIFPAFLGGKKCLPLGWVSKEANDRFSKIEAECSLYPMFSLMREFVGPGKRGRNSTPTLKRYQVFEKDGNFSIGYIYNAKPYIITSLCINIDSKVIIFESDIKDVHNININYSAIKNFFKCCDDKFITLSSDKVSPNIVILGVDNNKRVIAINSGLPFEGIKSKLEKIVNNIDIKRFNEFNKASYQVNVMSKQIIHLNKLYRFYAKIVFNVAAKINGYDIILDSQFNDVRNAIYNDADINKFVYICKGSFPLNKTFEKLEGITFDENTCHLVHLFIRDKSYYGMIRIFGVDIQYAIKLIENIKENFYPKTDLYVCDWKNGFEGSNIDITKKYFAICGEIDEERKNNDNKS